ncbi:unnamed protein product [Adineta steineri]|uniref:LITAF domain-containing protein n=1 Tax=Adineta steineri TaxID=433720 RepID=A0A814YEV1_9BILA|nr:unnamed protein product [Adineta steineri]
MNVHTIIPVDGAMSAANFSDLPVRAQCPQCRKVVMSQVLDTVGLGTWLLALVLLLIPPLCFVPFFIKACKDKEHRCPNCGAIMGVKKLVG